jgi:outer membrane protein TolC
LPASGGGRSLAEALGSPALALLIQRAYDSSPDLGAAGERVTQALAIARSARAAGMPVVGASAVSVYRGDFDFSNGFVGIDASFTPDLSGGRRARARAELARAGALAEDLEAQRLRTAADIARTFVQRATLARRIELIDTSIAQAATIERIVRLRVREGEASQVDLGLQSIRSRRLQAERLRLTNALEQSRVALALLVGEEAPAFAALPARLDAFNLAELSVPSPAELIANRPDVRASEARLRAAGGDVAVARAAFLPTISLSAGGAAQGAVLGGLSVGAGLLAPIFNRAELKAISPPRARQRETVHLYRQA